jgi:hypothetical protein
VCVQDFSVFGSRQIEQLWGAGKFIVMAISTFHYGLEPSAVVAFMP